MTLVQFCHLPRWVWPIFWAGNLERILVAIEDLDAAVSSLIRQDVFQHSYRLRARKCFAASAAARREGVNVGDFLAMTRLLTDDGAAV